MTDDVDNDDQWLYGDNPDGNPPQEEKQDAVEPEKPEETPPPIEPSPIDYPQEPPAEENCLPEPEDESQEKENGEIDNEQEDGELRQNGDDDEDLDDDDSDDGINVVIGDIKTTNTYPQPLNIKRGVLATAIVDKSKAVQPTGKFQVEEFEQIGAINGLSAAEYNLDSLEDKPWRKPGADITDYFNYGFNEDTWKAYCERQKRLRINESGVGVVPLNAIGLPRGPISTNENNKYPNQNFMSGSAIRLVQPSVKNNDPPKVNTIQVMTADRREYSRKPGFPDMSVPPPMSYNEPYPQPDYGFNPEPEPFYGGYEPTQDSQWMDGPMNSNWQPSEIKTLTGGSPPRPVMGPPSLTARSPSRKSPSKEREREREGKRSRDYDREKSRRRERSRSRSRRRRSRSRSHAKRRS